MSRLRDPVPLGLDDERVGVNVFRIISRGKPDTRHERMERVAGTTSQTESFPWVSQVAQDVMKDQLATNSGRKNPLDVFHHKNGWPASMKDPEVFLVQEVSVIFFSNIVQLSHVA